MNTLKKLLLASLCLLFTQPALAASPAERYARRCQGQAPERGNWPQGTALWGTRRTWDAEQKSDERRSVLVSVATSPLLTAQGGMKAVRLEAGRLVASPDASSSLVGTVLQGTSSDGKPVEVAICAVETSREDPGLHWYRIQAWNPVAQEWENPCLADGHVQDPRALAVQGVWDSSGAHHEARSKLTLACESGAIAKCIRWGYKPWASHDGKSMADLHQACTRMARADYCGNGRSHTRDNTIIDMYDAFGLLTRTTESSAGWDLARASFEAAWAPDGAACLARTRDGRELASILQECPGRFRTNVAVDLGEGDVCAVQRAGVSDKLVLLRNRSYGSTQVTGTSAQGK